jgi:2-polyprenyl-6-methoxyphenol hydroxylase-like FAD-dependent oxidoreductase
MILITGAGIAGLKVGLTLHQLGLLFRVLDRVSEQKPTGVGINQQPNAVHKLFDLGLDAALDRIGLRTRQHGFCTKTLRPIRFVPAMTWETAPTGKRGRQPYYSDAAVQTCLTMKVLFGMALRQIEPWTRHWSR